ncbi:MAG TPA: type I restriction enzyme HsdR N-terminal domain-containing protein [Trichormus sp. M33_DOE_039]|nr:type I restriction enzyme HsdR N-terminal domain-containing protein [Trichormus sp. M33_DOE_039]
MSPADAEKQFITWIQSFDYRVLQNQDDVETEFITPMFHHLCYPNKCCTKKSSLNSEKNTKQANQLENLQIYFSHDDVIHQNADTSLIIVICLSPNSNNFQEAIAQARFYSIYLRPLFFIITNGHQIKVFKYLLYHREECIIDKNVYSLKNSNTAAEFYKNYNYYYISNLDKNKINTLKYSQYNLIEKSLRRYNLQEVLAQTDFIPTFLQAGDRIIAVKPKVVIECNLPKAFKEGDCQIQFSGVILRGFKMKLNHRDILGQLMIGLNTRPEWGCRRFIKQIDKNAFEVTLGQNKIILSDLETADLCLCIDVVCQEYKQSIIEYENLLETWDFEFVEFLGSRGVHLFSVDAKLWRLMHDFANEFNYVQGKSEWHLFQQEEISIRVSRGIRDHAFILPRPVNYLSLLPSGIINIVYEINDIHLQSLETSDINSWKQDIGPRGTWTATYTKQWLLEKFIPKVIDYYAQTNNLSASELRRNIADYANDRTPILEVYDIQELVPYLKDIQCWLNNYAENIPAVILKDYYQTITNLLRNTDSSIEGIDYLIRNLTLMEAGNTRDKMKSNFSQWNFKDVLYYLDSQVSRINNYQYERSFKADLITRTFIWIIEHGKTSFYQSQLNVAKQALLPLWEQSRFEMRYVNPYRQ